MGMFSALKNKVHSATICYLSSKIRAVKNRMVEYLYKMPKERREYVVLCELKNDYCFVTNKLVGAFDVF